jgi:hypothetical protein
LAGVAAGFAVAFSSALTAGAGVALLVSAGLPAFASASFSALVFGLATLGISFGVAGADAAAAGFLTSSTLVVPEAKADVAATATTRVATRFFILSFL